MSDPTTLTGDHCDNCDRMAAILDIWYESWLAKQQGSTLTESEVADKAYKQWQELKEATS